MSQPEISTSSEMSPSPSYAPSPPPPKPSSPSAGERLLTLLIRFIVMCFALPLFFLFASVSAILLLHICLAGYALRRHHHNQLDTNPNNPNSGLCSDDLKRMASFRWPWPPDRSCAVCLEKVKQGEMCRKLRACQHVFHKGCVDKWLVLSPNCPLCREAVRPDSWI
ncbi:hypothetical protein LUZ60_017220 [Juncus effusus]|nr:hypothetical protein LUZ60_017220 [Juncus effusus]